MTTLGIALTGAAVLLLFTAPSVALDIALSGASAEPRRIDATYACTDGRSFAVTYIDAGAIGLAILPPREREPLVFVRVLSGSGSRYVANAFQWWIRGNEATLANLTDGPEATGTKCTAR